MYSFWVLYNFGHIQLAIDYCIGNGTEMETCFVLYGIHNFIVYSIYSSIHLTICY